MFQSLIMAAAVVLAVVPLPETIARGGLPRADAAATAAPQLRAIWVDAFGDGIYTESQIDELVAYTKATNLNAIVAQVVRRGDCFCASSIAPRTDAGIAPAPFDPLQSLIAKAHAQGIQVHAWVIATAIWKGTTPPAATAHVFNLHGPSRTGRDDWTTYRSDGLDVVAGDYHLDPGHPDAADWVARLVASIVANYDVDGVNLDRIRYPDGNLGGAPSWGYNPTALARFQAATGRSDRPAPADAQWAQWRRDQVTAIVRRIYVETYAAKPRVQVSIDGIAYGGGPAAQGGWERTRTYAEVLQDWRGWLAEGIVDLAIPMNYKRDSVTGGSGDQRVMYDQWSEFARDHQYGRAAATGSALYLNEIGESVRQIREALRTSAAGKTAAGWVGYSYRTPDEQTNAGTRSGAASRGLLQYALTQPSTFDATTPPVFATAAPVPDMPWKTAATLGHLRGTLTDAAGQPLADRTVTLVNDATGALVRTLATDGRGWFGFVDLAPGRYRATSGSQSAVVNVAAGAVVTASFAQAACQSSEGPGIAPPAKVTSGIPGLHAAWYGQSGYPTLCAGDRSVATVAFYNTGSVGWVAGRMGEMAYLGTWEPEPGQDRASVLGGDGTNGSPATGWPRYNRVAGQPAQYVGPGQVAWFQFTVQAPSTPGTYRLAIRPLIEGARWLEDYGVFWYVTVK